MNTRWLLGGIVTAAVVLGGYSLITRQSVSEQQNDATAVPTRQPEGSPTPVAAEDAANDMASDCNGVPTPALAEGPYYTANTPERTDIREAGTLSEQLTITGYVFDTNCQPIANAWLDFWQADGQGQYDNAGYNLRGHQFTNAAGQYRLETILPAEYSGRTPHIHVKVRATEQSSVLTTQLFLPDAAQNETDPIFNQALVMKVTQADNGRVATHNFVLSTQ